MTRPAASDDVLVRLLGAFGVGLVAAPVIGVSLVVALFGGLGTALVVLAVIVAVATAGLTAVQATTTATYATRAAAAPKWGWALGVVCGALVVAGTTAAAWQHAGHAFGQAPLLWAVGVGMAFALAAAAGTRPTRWPALVGIAAVLLLALAELRPELPQWERRGCIASSAEQAERICS